MAPTMATTAPSTRPCACAGAAAVHRASRAIAKPAITTSRPARRTRKEQLTSTAGSDYRTNPDNYDGGKYTCSPSCGHKRRSSSSSLPYSSGREYAAAAAAMPTTAARITPIIKVVHASVPTLIRTDPSNFRALVQQLTGNNSIDPGLSHHDHGHDDNGRNEAVITDHSVPAPDNCDGNSAIAASLSGVDNITDHQPAGYIADHRCSSHNSWDPQKERNSSTCINSTSYQMEDITDDGQSPSWINHSVNELQWSDQDNLSRLNTILFAGQEGEYLSTDFSEDQSSADLHVMILAASEELFISCNSSANSTSAVSCSAHYDCHTTTSSTHHHDPRSTCMDSWNQLHQTVCIGDLLSADNELDQELILNIDSWRDMHYNSCLFGEPKPIICNTEHFSSHQEFELPLCRSVPLSTYNNVEL